MAFRTVKQIKADKLDLQLHRLMSEAEGSGYADAARELSKIRRFFRKEMHKDDVKETK